MYWTNGSTRVFFRMTDPGQSSPNWNLDEVQDVVEERVGVYSGACTLQRHVKLRIAILEE